MNGISSDVKSASYARSTRIYSCVVHATKDMTLLKTEVRCNEHTNKKDLILTLQNAQNEVSYRWVYGLKSVTRTDVTDTIIDLDRGAVVLPYKV